MKAIGIVRRVDSQGRISIPIEIRQTLNLSENDMLELCEEAGTVILSKHMSSVCIFCGRDDNLVQFKGRAVCRKCMIAAEYEIAE